MSFAFGLGRFIYPLEQRGAPGALWNVAGAPLDFAGEVPYAEARPYSIWSLFRSRSGLGGSDETEIVFCAVDPLRIQKPI
jgi:hypothetical protein